MITSFYNSMRNIFNMFEPLGIIKLFLEFYFYIKILLLISNNIKFFYFLNHKKRNIIS